MMFFALGTSLLNINKAIYSYICFFLGIVLMLFIVAYITKNRKLKSINEKYKLIDNIFKTIKEGTSLEENLGNILKVVSTVVFAPSYGFFTLDEKNQKYVLRAIRNNSDENIEVGPSYSGLLPYKKEKFFIPNVLDLQIMKSKTTLIKEGEVPALIIPFEGSNSLILVGPVKKVHKKTLESLDTLNEKVSTLINVLSKDAEWEEKIKVTLSSSKAVKNMSNIFTDYTEMLNTIFNITVNSVGASGGIFIKSLDNKVSIESVIGFESDTKEFLLQDRNLFDLLSGFLINKKSVFINNKKSDFYKLPPYFVANEFQGILVVKLDSDNFSGIVVLCYKDDYELKDYKITALRIMIKRMCDIIENHLKIRGMANSYVDILRMLAKIVDNSSATTVGYSELMYRYSVIIAKELRLPVEEIKDIALAAYLSNIGIVGLSDQLLRKKGKYSEVEYETMKLHAEVGASLIEATIANNNVAAIIRHHHERIDGFGYPAGLKDNEIPVGSKILAVVQTFLAKIQAREYRTALPFDKALEQLRNASGTQLDENSVEALISWYNRKQKQNLHSKSSLGRCFEMRCSPESICAECPAYKNASVNCWENKTNNCTEHGNNCESCFVRTEYLARVAKANR